MEHLELARLEFELKSFIDPTFGERYEVRRDTADGGITGYVVRRDWRGVSFSQRQRELNDFIVERLGSASDISLILTFSPEEYEAWAEDQAAAS